jgi:hypothetical protein
MQAVTYVKTSGLLLLSILPLSFIGYFFSTGHETLFFLYEWILAAVVVMAGIVALRGAFKTEDQLKWILISILTFVVQFSVLSLFLGPFTVYPMIIIYFAVTVAAFCIYIFTLFKVDRYRFINVLFLVISSLFTFYMMFLQMLWGKDLT